MVGRAYDRRDDRQPKGKIVATYDYVDDGGAVLFQAVRFEPKDFRQRRPNSSGWAWSTKGVRQVPYRLPELAEAIASERPVIIVEGEKDVDALARWGIPATCNAGGAGKWRDELNPYFDGADVVIIPDRDPQRTHPKTGELMFHADGRPMLPGQDHAQDVARRLAPVARRVRILELWRSWSEMPLKGDVSDWIAAGGTAEAFWQLVEAAPKCAQTRPSGPAKQPKEPYSWKKIGVNAGSIRMMKFNPITFLVRDLIPNEGITLICAKPKVGKSWLVLDIAVAATMNRYVLGDIKPEQGDVLYLALEDSLRRIQSRMTKLLPTFTDEWPETLTFATTWRRVDQGGLDDIREWAVEARAAGRKIAFVAIDVLKMVRPPNKAGQPPYEADYEAIKGLHQLAIDLAIPIVVIHHTRKADADDLIDKVSGTAGLTGAVDTIIVIERQAQGTVFDVRGRDIKANTLAAEFNKETCRWTILGAADAVHRSSERARILEIFSEAAEPLTPKAVTDAVICDHPLDHRSHRSQHAAVRQLLGKMAKDGELIRTKPGKSLMKRRSCSH